MIGRDVLEDVAGTRGITVRNAEKEYMIDICLATVSRRAKGLVFKGGTALYKFYGLNRFSENIDFVQGGKRLDMEWLQEQVTRSAGLLGINACSDPVEDHQREVNAVMHFNGPLYDGRKASVARMVFNISLRERPRHHARRLCTSPFSDIPSYELDVMEKEEVLAEKIRAVLTRDKPRDIYDIWFLLGKGVLPTRGLVERKLKIYRKRFEPKELYKRMEQMRGAWKRDLGGMLIGDLPRFNDVLERIREGLDAAFCGQ